MKKNILMLAGDGIGPEIMDEAKKIILEDFQPLSDMRASATYRSLISQNLLERFYLEKKKEKQNLD